MSISNPYKSPAALPDSREEAAARRLRRPFAWTGFLLFVGVIFLLLLNGQVFTNGIVFLGCAVLSATLWVPHLFPSPRNEHARLAFYILLAHLVLIATFASSLPSRYRWQQGFNDTINELRERAASGKVER